jgi:transmembrane sensor
MALTRLEFLYQLCITNRATQEEHQEMVRLMLLPENESLAKQLLNRAYLEPKETTDVTTKEAASILQAIFLAAAENPRLTNIDLHAQSRKFNKAKWWSAAAIMILIGTGIYFFAIKKSQTRVELGRTQQQEFKNDISPGGNKAILTLGNGSRIILDSFKNGLIAQQGNAKIIKQNSSQLTYNASFDKSTEIIYNTLTTPRGGQYQLELPDGTMVWLNAASSIRYPTVFAGKERKVEIAGETYFEVTKNPKMPFIVNINHFAEVEVIGTHFNVMAYGDEPVVKTTLLEGAVKFSMRNAKTILKPGDQAELSPSGDMKVINNANLADVIAWKNGYFQFHRAGTRAVMRQIARWYDVEISYEGNIPEEQLGGRISRNNNASEVLKILEVSNIHFRIDGKRIIVIQ